MESGCGQARRVEMRPEVDCGGCHKKHDSVGHIWLLCEGAAATCQCGILVCPLHKVWGDAAWVLLEDIQKDVVTPNRTLGAVGHLCVVGSSREVSWDLRDRTDGVLQQPESTVQVWPALEKSSGRCILCRDWAGNGECRNWTGASTNMPMD